jgi:hypothetical protein
VAPCTISSFIGPFNRASACRFNARTKLVLKGVPGLASCRSLQLSDLLGRQLQPTPFRSTSPDFVDVNVVQRQFPHVLQAWFRRETANLRDQ